MDVIISLIMILIIIGIILLIKNQIKFKIKEGLGVSVVGGLEEDKEEIKVKPDKDSDGYELVGSAAPPSFKDAIYDHNLKYAKTVSEELGCDPQSKYAPNIHNKDNLFDSTHGWAREDYKFRVKSLNVEANKAEYNYYDWGKYKYRDQTQTQQELSKEVTTDISANLWDMDKKKIGSNWKTTINRPKIVKYPMGIRKAKTLCYGKDPGDYKLPKIGDKVKIRKKVDYNSPYFAGIVVANKQDAKDSDPIEVLWYQKGNATIDSKTNKVINYFNTDNCNLTNLSTDEDGCTRDVTQKVPREAIIDLDKEVSNSIGWKMFGSNKEGGNGQQDWFGSPDLSLQAYKNTNDKYLDAINKSGVAWKDRYLKDTKKKIPDKLKNYDNDAKLKTMLNDGSIDPKAVFKIKECQQNSACEDLRCSTIAEKIKKQYPLTKVCKVEHKNTYEETKGQYCNSGTNKGATFTYFSEPPLCSFQDYGGDNQNLDFPKNFCNVHCNDCKDISKMKGNWQTSYWAEVWSQPNCKGQKAIVRGKDGQINVDKLFPSRDDNGNQLKIKSFKLFGVGSVAMMGDWSINPGKYNYGHDKGDFYRVPYTHPSGNAAPTTFNILDSGNAKLAQMEMSGVGYELHDSYHSIQILKSHYFRSKKKLIRLHGSSPKNSVFEEISIPSMKAEFMQISGVIFGDQNWGNPTYLNMRADYSNGGKKEIGKVDMNYEKDGQSGYKTGTRGGSSSVGGGQNCGASDDYGKSICRYYDNEREINKVQSELSEAFSCNHWRAVFSLGYYNCSVQQDEFDDIQAENRYDLIKLQEASRSIIKLHTNLNAIQIYSIGATKPVNKITLYPSWIGNGHETIYLGFSQIVVYESLK